MTRDRRRPPLLESLEGKQLLSTIRPGLAGPQTGVVRQAGAAAVAHTVARPSTLGNLNLGTGHSRIGQAAGSFATGRMAVLNSVRFGLISRSLQGNVPGGNSAGPNHLDLRAGMLSPAARMAVASTSSIPSTPGSSSRIIQAPAPPPNPTVTPTAPTAQSTLAQTLALHANLR